VSTRIWLYRHAEAEKNLDPNKVGGQNKCSPLTTTGKWQAERLAGTLLERSPFGAIYTSQCTRSIQTGEAIRRALPYGIEMFALRELDELSQGVFEDQPRTNFVEMIDRHPDEKVCCGQSMRDVGDITQYMLARIGEWHPGQDVAVVGHAVAVKCFIASLRSYTKDAIQYAFRLKIPHCSETKIVYNEGNFAIEAIGRKLF
jgi:broad specificity phosphatase PhoE